MDCSLAERTTSDVIDPVDSRTMPGRSMPSTT